MRFITSCYAAILPVETVESNSIARNEFGGGLDNAAIKTKQRDLQYKEKNNSVIYHG